MSVTWILVVFAFGVNFALWGTIGLARATTQLWTGRISRHRKPPPADELELSAEGCDPRSWKHLAVADVAVLMAAHNEETVIEESLAAIAKIVPSSNIYVVSDGSKDRTVELALRQGVHVMETPANVGKACALEAGIKSFRLVEGFPVLLLLDADTRLDPSYFDEALPLFGDPEVVAIAGCAHSHWRWSGVSMAGMVLTAHRSRVYALVQRLLKFGQTWRPTNATHIVPGFASLYRTRVLPHIDISRPGLVIEDFNMTFEVYRKRLGKVGFSLRARAVTQDPDRFRDYVRQTKRWALGFWQTVRLNRPRADLFSVMVALFFLELLSSSVMLVLLPFVVVFLVVPDLLPQVLEWPGMTATHSALADNVGLEKIFVGMVLPDLLLTLAVSIAERRPRYLLFAVFFLPLRVLDAILALYTLPQAWLARSGGDWVSPTRFASSDRDFSKSM